MPDKAMLILWERRNHATLLLISIVLLLLVSPIAMRHRYSLILMAPLIILVFAAAARLASQYRRAFRTVVIPLAVAWLAARVSGAAVDVPSGQVQIAPLLGLPCIICLLLFLLRGLAEARRITTETISQAFSGYLVIALAFAQFYDILTNLIPGAFNPPAPPGSGSDYSQYIYFSIITLTTTGYGDVTAVDPFVRIVAAMEAMGGVFYQTVVLARLVALYMPRHPLQQSPELGRQPDGAPMPSEGS